MESASYGAATAFFGRGLSRESGEVLEGDESSDISEAAQPQLDRL